MALPGLRSTNDMGTDGRPKNWREGLLLLEPRNRAPLFSLTAAMSSQPTDDPEFNWWEESLDLLNYQLNGAVLIGATTIIVDERATRLKVGDLLRNEATEEIIRVASVTNDTTFEVTRGAANTTPAAMADNERLLYIGSAYREGAPKAEGTSYNPTKKYNYTQIFRDPIEWTRTAMKTRLRYTTDIMKEDRRRALNKHSIGIERAIWLGQRYETTESGQPIRYTGGVLSFIPAANKVTIAGGGGALDMDELMSYFPDIFAYGSSEKVAFTSLRVLSILGEVVRKNTQFQWGPNEREYGMNVKRLYTPAGTLTLTEHPLFGQGDNFLSDSIVVLDTAQMKYRYIDDTKLLKDRETPGVDGKSEEYLTECGFEFHNTEAFFQLKGIVSAAADA
jgi:hypothetical protein